MQTFDPVLVRGRTVWDREVLPEALFAQRLRDIRHGMAERQLDVLLVYGDVRQHGSLAWLTNYLPRVRDAFLLLSRERGEHLFVNVSSRDVPFAQSISAVQAVSSFDRLDPEATELIRAWRSKPSRWGLVDVAQQMPAALWERLLPGEKTASYPDLTGWFEALRLRKEAPERAAIAQAARLAGLALTRGLGQAIAGMPGKRPGDTGSAAELREFGLAAVIERAARRAGAEDVRVLISAGGPLGRGGERAVPPGGRVALYVAVKWHRYWAEVGRTFTRLADGWSPLEGEAARRVRETLDSLRAATSLADVRGLARSLATSPYPQLESVGIDAAEPWPPDAEAPVLEAAGSAALTLAVRWGGAGGGSACVTPELWAETVEWRPGELRVLTVEPAGEPPF